MLAAAIVLEAVIALLALLAAVKGRRWLFGFAFTFAVYVFYDAARLMQVNVQEGVMSVLFLLAAASALASMWDIYRKV
jgi:hypothetical protein